MEYAEGGKQYTNDPGPVQSALVKKLMIPGGGNRKSEVCNTQQHPGPFEDTIEEKELIPGGCNRQKEAINNQLTWLCERHFGGRHVSWWME